MSLGDLQSGLPEPPPRSEPPAPLLPLAVGLMAGIVGDNLVAPPTWTAVLPLALGGGLLWVMRRGRLRTSGRLALLAVALMAIGLGALRHSLSDRWEAEEHIVFHTAEEPLLVRIEGRVLTLPTIAEPSPEVPHAYPTGPKTRFLLEAETLAGEAGPIAVCGYVAVVVRDAVLGLNLGDRVRMTGWLHRPRGPMNPGAYDWALHARRSGIRAGFSCSHAESVIITAGAGGAGWRGLLEQSRARLRGYLLDDAFEEGDPGAGIIAAMVMAARSAVPQAMNEAFVRTGNAHFLAASGMNVGWLALVGWGFMRLIGAHYRTTTVVVALLITSYVLLAEPQPSILRAGIIGVVTCLSIYRRGRYNALNSLALAVIIILLLDPTDVFRPAFQYSFMAVLALLHLCPHVAKAIASWFLRLNLPRIARSFDRTLYGAMLATTDLDAGSTTARHGRRLGYWAAQLAALSISAWLITAPLSCYYFNNFTPFGWLQTMLLWFLALPVTMVGYVTLALGALFPSSGAVLGPLLKIGTDLLVGLVQLLARIPGTMVNGRSPSMGWTLAVYLVLGIWVYRRGWIPWRHGFTTATLVLLLWWLVPPRWARAESDALNVWVLAVGDGNANVVELPGGQVILYDCGTRSSFDSGRVAVAFLKQRGITRIDAAFISHPNFDHYSGMEGLTKDLPVGRIILNDQYERFSAEDASARRFLTRMKRQGIPIETIHAPWRMDDTGPAVVEMLWPPSVEERAAIDANESSTVLRVTYQGRSILLTGDICEVSMGALAARPDEIKAAAVVLPHHGGVTHNTGKFLAAVDPQVAVRSAGQARRMTTNGIEQLVAPRRYFNTADDGCVLLRVADGELNARAVMVRE